LSIQLDALLQRRVCIRVSQLANNELGFTGSATGLINVSEGHPMSRFRKLLKKCFQRRGAARRQRSERFVPCLEPLESRRMLAVTAVFSVPSGVLSVFGDSLNNTIEVSRNAAGNIFVNGGAVSIGGGTPTVANTALVQVFGLSGQDTITLNETNGALPRAHLYGGDGNDVLRGGSGADRLFGQAGTDTLFGLGGVDMLFGGATDDFLTGGDGDDQSFGQNDNDRMIWNPGDDTDLNEGGAGVDTVEVNGGNGVEDFTTTANGLRVRFDRVNPAPFSLDIGTSENLVLNANGGNDTFSATGNLAALILITVDGGAGDDTISGSNGADVLLGGDNNDFIDGQQGNDLALMGAGEDTFQWDPGDGNDTVEGQAGIDTLLFNASNTSEIIDISANAARVRLFRNVGSVTTDLDDVERINVNMLGGTDTITINDLAGTDASEVNVNLAGVLGGVTGDSQADAVIFNGTSGVDSIVVNGSASGVSVLGLFALVNIANAETALDRLTVNLLAGDDVLDATGLTATGIALTGDGGIDDDSLTGGDGADVLLGGDGDDILIGGPGVDTLDGGLGDNILIQ
jgi:Ca2+-binding RTX toxin-like protein